MGQNIDPGMLQMEKPVLLLERMVTSFTRTEVSAQRIKTSACNEILIGAPGHSDNGTRSFKVCLVFQLCKN